MLGKSQRCYPFTGFAFERPFLILTLILLRLCEESRNWRQDEAVDERWIALRVKHNPGLQEPRRSATSKRFTTSPSQSASQPANTLVQTTHAHAFASIDCRFQFTLFAGKSSCQIQRARRALTSVPTLARLLRILIHRRRRTDAGRSAKILFEMPHHVTPYRRVDPQRCQ